MSLSAFAAVEDYAECRSFRMAFEGVGVDRVGAFVATERRHNVQGVAGGDLPVRDGLAVAKSSIIGHLFAGEKGVRSSVRRDNSPRGTGGCG